MNDDAEKSASSGASRGRRKLRNFLLDPKTQFRSALPIFVVGVGAISVLFGTVIYGITETITMFAELSPPSEEIVEVTDRTRLLLWSTYAILMVAFIFSSLFLAAVITHRYIGPIVPIQRQLRKLINGDYTGIVELRKNDAFQDLARDVNELTEKLAKSR